MRLSFRRLSGRDAGQTLTVALVLAIVTLPLHVAHERTGRLSCAAPRLVPSLVVTGSLAGVPYPAGQPAGAAAPSWVAPDAQGDVVWAEQAGPPAAGRLFDYDAHTRRVAIVASRYTQSSQRIGLVSLSPRWLVFSTFAGIFDGSQWRIVVHDRQNGQERVVASSPLGGAGSAQFDLDGDMLVWVQPIAPQGSVIHIQDLRTGRDHILASTRVGIYTVLKVNGGQGHAVWEWIRRSNGSISIDLLLVSLAGGAVHMIADSADQPQLAWPRVVYIKRTRSGMGMLVVQDMQTGRSQQLLIGRDDDLPQITGSLVVYRSMLLPSFYNPTTGQHTVLSRPVQYTVKGAPLFDLHVGGGVLAGVGHDGAGHYILAIFRLRGVDPLDDVLTC